MVEFASPQPRGTLWPISLSLGRTEDALLLEKFGLYCERNAWNRHLPFRAVFAAKEENISGLQVADLAAYTVARFVQTGNGDRPDWKAIEPRFRRGPKGIFGWGLKVFP